MDTAKKTYQRMKDWDFSGVLEFHTSVEEVDDPQGQLDAYLRFMALCATHKIPIAISREVDPLWHNHILHTEDYKRFCETFAGRMLHHYPAVRGVIHQDLRENYLRTTVNLHAESFGPDEIWFPSDPNSAICFCAYEVRLAA